MKIILVAGLGNPGKKYEKTRHNAGFMFTDYFWKKYADEFGFSDWEFKKKLNVEVSIGKTGDKKIILAKPCTFMNLSGTAIAAAMKYYKAKPDDIFVVHDEVDLSLGNYRFSSGASSAGHQGVQNVIDALGTKNFTRLRIGVDNRRNKSVPTEKYVLGQFTNEELNIMLQSFEMAFGELVNKIKTEKSKVKTTTQI